MPISPQGGAGAGANFTSDTGTQSLASRVIQTYTTFSGIDITAVFDNMILATLSGVATSLTREKVPIFTFGSADARSISRGKRACAGSLQFTLFDRDAFYSLFLDENHFYYAHANEINTITNPINTSEFTGLFFDTNGAGQFTTTGLNAGQLNLSGGQTGGGQAVTGAAGLQGRNPRTFGTGVAGAPVIGVSGVNNGANDPSRKVGALSVRRAAQHADQVFPFDITLIAQNEYGRAASSAIVGVEIINEGGGVSVDDITNEQQMTFIAITKSPWTPLTQDGPQESLFGKITNLTQAKQNADGTSSVTLGSAAAQFRTVATA